MATIDFTYLDDTGAQDGSVGMYTWTPLTTTNTDGRPVFSTQFADRCVQVTGTFGAGGSVTVQGSNDGTNWSTLNTAQGAAVAITALASGLKQIVEVPRYMRPLVTAGDGTTSVSVTMLIRRTNPMRQ